MKPWGKREKWRERRLELWPVSRGTEIRAVIKSSYLNRDVAEDCSLQAPWPVCHFHYLWQADSIAINIHLLLSQLDALLHISSTTHQHCAGLPEVKKAPNYNCRWSNYAYYTAVCSFQKYFVFLPWFFFFFSCLWIFFRLSDQEVSFLKPWISRRSTERLSYKTYSP